MRKSRIGRAAVRRIDEAWHEQQMVLNAPELEQRHVSAQINFSILDKMPERVRKLIDELGPDAPDWANEWFATGSDPRHRQEREVPVFPY
jgi:hypothetical protein